MSLNRCPSSSLTINSFLSVSTGGSGAEVNVPDVNGGLAGGQSSSTTLAPTVSVSPYSSSNKYTVSMKENTVIFETSPATLVHDSPRVVTSSPVPTTHPDESSNSRGDFVPKDDLEGGEFLQNIPRPLIIRPLRITYWRWPYFWHFSHHEWIEHDNSLFLKLHLPLAPGGSDHFLPWWCQFTPHFFFAWPHNKYLDLQTQLHNRNTHGLLLSSNSLLSFVLRLLPEWISICWGICSHVILFLRILLLHQREKNVHQAPMSSVYHGLPAPIYQWICLLPHELCLWWVYTSMKQRSSSLDLISSGGISISSD